VSPDCGREATAACGASTLSVRIMTGRQRHSVTAAVTFAELLEVTFFKAPAMNPTDSRSLEISEFGRLSATVST